MRRAARRPIGLFEEVEAWNDLADRLELSTDVGEGDGQPAGVPTVHEIRGGPVAADHLLIVWPSGHRQAARIGEPVEWENEHE